MVISFLNLSISRWLAGHQAAILILHNFNPVENRSWRIGCGQPLIQVDLIMRPGEIRVGQSYVTICTLIEETKDRGKRRFFPLICYNVLESECTIEIQYENGKGLVSKTKNQRGRVEY